jgi:C4-dicarboxylate transporter DctQ subunit
MMAIRNNQIKMVRLSAKLKIVEQISIGTLVILTLLLIFTNVVLRYGFNYTLTWAEELARFFFITITYIGAAAGIRRKGHIIVDMAAVLIPKASPFLAKLSHSIGCIFSLIIFYASLRYALFLLKMGQVSIGLGVPMWIPYLGVIMGSFLMAFRFGEAFWLNAGSKKSDVDKS